MSPCIFYFKSIKINFKIISKINLFIFLFLLLQPNIFFFWIRGNLTLRKAHFVGSGEGVKPRLSQALTRGARPDSNSRPAV